MELQCAICDEYWDTLTDDLDMDEIEAINAGRGCPSCMGKENNEEDRLASRNNSEATRYNRTPRERT